MTTPFRVTAQFWDHATLWSDDDSEAGHSTDGGRVFGITRTRYVECDRYGCKPVAVIDPENSGSVARLVQSMLPLDDQAFSVHVRKALREFADPKPPMCRAALSIKGEHFACDQLGGHGMVHGNSAAEAIWGEPS